MVQRYAAPSTSSGAAPELNSDLHAQRASRWWREWMAETTRRFGDPLQWEAGTPRQDPEFDLELPAFLSSFPPRQTPIELSSGLSEEDVGSPYSSLFLAEVHLDAAMQ